jgi:ATP/ADP translocase
MLGTLSAFFNVRPGEGRLVSLLALQYFFLGAAFVFTQTAAFAMFLDEFGPQGLPFVYLAIAIGASLAAFLYLKLGERLPLSKLLVANLASLAILSLGLRLGLLLPRSRLFVFILPVWFQILANFVILAVWTLAGRLLDVRQAKRLFGLIGLGYWLAIAAGGFLIASIVAVLGTANLLVLATIWLAIIVALGREYPAALARALRKRHLGGSTIAFVEQAYGAALHESLASPHPAAVIFGLNLLEQADPALLAPALPDLLEHPSPEVRGAALDRTARDVGFGHLSQ